MKDVYALHRLALAPFVASEDHAPFMRPTAVSEARLVEFLSAQGLAPLWHHHLVGGDRSGQYTESFAEKLAARRKEAALHYLLQASALPELRDVLDRHQIAHVVYKGVANRETLYANPSLRPAADIDVLVAPSNRDRAISCLAREGFRLSPGADNASHEISLQRGALTIDLHWDILRPGRTRQPMAEALLQGRIDAASHWRMADAGALFVALVHPVFAKYATAPQSSLVRCLDLMKLLGRNTDHSELKAHLDVSGLRTAAWIMLRWLELLRRDLAAPEADGTRELRKELAPNPVQKAYLDQWLTRNLATRLERHQAFVQLGLTCAAHDQLSDAVAALKSIRRHRSEQALVLGELQRVASANSQRGATRDDAG